MKTIVIIEDHPVLISVYRNKFIAEGFQVEIATDGDSGFKLINRIQPDLVVLDLAMPKLNGIEVLKRLRANPLFQDLPVIIFSDSAWKQQAWKEGATVVLSKSEHSPSDVVESARDALLACEARPEQDTLAINAAFLAGHATSPGTVTQSVPTAGHVLLVEDHHDLRTTISAALDQSGFRVTTVESHAAVLPEVEAREFDAFLVNRLCPDGIGLSLCRRLRNLYPKKAIVMYSTAAFSITPEQRLQAGANAYLTEAGEILNPGRVLLKLIAEAKTTSAYVDCEAAGPAVNAYPLEVATLLG
jgi:CheY-like chemotaxis protein